MKRSLLFTMINIISLILCGISFYMLLELDDPMLILLGGMAIGWTSTSIIFNWGEQS